MLVFLDLAISVGKRLDLLKLVTQPIPDLKPAPASGLLRDRVPAALKKARKQNQAQKDWNERKLLR